MQAERAQHTEVVPRYGSAMIARIDALSCEITFFRLLFFFFANPYLNEL